jgi:hypothetical protein
MAATLIGWTMPRRLPVLAVILTIAGIVPFILCGLGAVATNAITSQLAAYVLIGYGAVILSFLGGVHWGFTLAVEHDPAERPRLVLGIVPALVGWAALAAALYSQQPVLGLAMLIAAFILIVVAEWNGHGRDWVPGGYIGMRIAVTVVVVAILTTVAVLRMIGGHLIF